MSRALAAALLLATSCHTLAGGGGKANIDAACVLLGDGAICTFTNAGGAGARCVRILLGANEGTVVASSPICSGKLGHEGQSTVVVKFATAPREMCGDGLAQCQTRVVDRDAASGEATTWAAELKTHYSGPATPEDCKAVAIAKYKIYAEEDCRGGSPQDKQACVQQMMTERDENMESMVQDCLQYDPRQLINCYLKAKTNSDLSQCEDQYPPQ